MKDEAPLYGTSSASCLRELEVIKVSEGGAQEITETVAVEAAVKISYGIGITKSVSLSPKDLYDYTLGHAFTSGIISSPDDLIDFALCTDSDPMKIVATVRKDLNLKDIQTSRAKQGGVFEEPGTSLPPEAIWSINETLLSKQELHQLTGATHAASFVGFDGELLYIREDVGRHNAVEKLIGALLSNKVDPREGFAFLSSRCALELVQKLACYGIRTIAAISAPTSAVIDYALSQGITICAFSRGKRFTVYTHPERLSIHLD
ncbi:MAG: formate dehydrogenase accessory sulfurtransferase FdhD [Coriobacteriia bacterium]|nr:formate dehydrogenase accessory sulfurtransferase FdhD [Coriobacteriia bacterium]